MHLLRNLDTEKRRHQTYRSLPVFMLPDEVVSVSSVRQQVLETPRCRGAGAAGAAGAAAPPPSPSWSPAPLPRWVLG